MREVSMLIMKDAFIISGHASASNPTLKSMSLNGITKKPRHILLLLLLGIWKEIKVCFVGLFQSAGILLVH